MSRPFAIYDDLSGVTELADGQGAFATRKAAIERQIELLESRRTDIVGKLTRAKRMLRRQPA